MVYGVHILLRRFHHARPLHHLEWVNAAEFTGHVHDLVSGINHLLGESFIDGEVALRGWIRFKAKMTLDLTA
ncbi:Uncharacterised protein [Vibrio cholerae]|nr:Uncharacterised protein [Vibrio cholerae]